MISINTLKPYIVKRIEDLGGQTSPDYKTFQSKFKNYLKKVCSEHGFELVNFSPNHYCFSCFIKGNGNFVYISISDVRYFNNEWFTHILIRTAKHEKDYTGGSNQYINLPNLEGKICNMLAPQSSYFNARWDDSTNLAYQIGHDKYLERM